MACAQHHPLAAGVGQLPAQSLMGGGYPNSKPKLRTVPMRSFIWGHVTVSRLC